RQHDPDGEAATGAAGLEARREDEEGRGQDQHEWRRGQGEGWWPRWEDTGRGRAGQAVCGAEEI
ncbi:hypothetical protein LTR16_009125, partial [Cryomyces antarcticus]